VALTAERWHTLAIDERAILRPMLPSAP